jgi:pilus assembly protein CpaF
VSSLDRILPFLKPIADLLCDPAITEVMVNDGGRRVFVEREGMIEAIAGRTLETRNLTVAIKNIARACGDEISEAQPLLDARLEDGSRVAAMFPPCAVAGPVLTIRKFSRRYSLDDLVAVGSVTASIARELTHAVATEQNILISGGTGTGKTTLLNALAAHIPDRDRIVLRKRPRFTWTNRTFSGSRPDARKRRLVRRRPCRRSRSRTCCAPRCGTGRIAFSWAKSVGRRHSIFCRL